MNSFCPQLQLPWSLRSLEARNLARVAINVAYCQQVPVSTDLGCHISEIASYPKISTTVAEAEFVFLRCLSVTVREEMLVSISEKTPEGEGQTFLRFLSSPQIDAARLGRPEGLPLFHYRLIFQDEIIDVVCSEVAEVDFKHSCEQDAQATE